MQVPAQIFGQEFLGAAKYAAFAIKNLPKGRCGKTFAKEFGNSMPILRAWAEQGTHPVIATQGLWRGGAHDYSGQKILTEGLKELEKFARIASNFPSQGFQFSIFCEHKLRTPYLKEVFVAQWEIVKNIPNITLVNTPMEGGDLLPPNAFGIPRLLNEIHGVWNPSLKGKASYMWGCDGLPAQDCDIQKFKNRHELAIIIWLWMQQYNCKAKVDDSTPISQRTVRPVAKQVISLERLTLDKGRVKFTASGLFKSHADQHGNTPAPREQKPVIIVKRDAEKLIFVANNGKEIFSAERKGNYEDGRPMYRCSIWGFELQNRAVRASGNAIVSVIAIKNGKRTRLGTVNPAFRENAWRLKMLKSGAIEEIEIISPDWV